jgi:Flp pilus assembly protein TadG
VLFYIVGIATFLVLMMLLIAVTGYFYRLSRFEQAAATVSDLAVRASELRQRVQLVETSAVDYVNSIGKDGIAVLEELQRRVDDVTFFINELEALVESGETAAISEVELLLGNQHPRQQNVERSYDGTIRDLRYNPLWDSEIEGLLQRLGEDVSSASLAATRIGVPKRRKRKTTIHNLLRAGIRLGSEQDSE